MPKLTILYTYFGQKEMIPQILAEKHPDTKIVIIDDCSPEPLARAKGINIYRIDDNIEWNQGGARNLGFHVAKGWIVYADIDHLISQQTQAELLKIKKKKGTVYFLGRNSDSKKVLSVYLIHKDDFEKVGGYDEDFCGHYGREDLLFYNQCQANLNMVERTDIKAIDYSETAHSQGDRNINHNEALYHAKTETRNTSPRLRFKWHKV
jgi:predicted glycosyltransferase involved in capsule biosynthesis